MKRSLYFQYKDDELASLVTPVLREFHVESRVVECPAGVDEMYPDGYMLVALRDVENSEGVLVIRKIRDIEKKWSQQKIDSIKAKMREIDPAIDFGKLTKEQFQELVVQTNLGPSRLAYQCVESWDFSRMAA